MKRFEAPPSLLGRMAAVWNRIETVVIVSIVTVLIWLYAERESIRRGEIGAQIRLVAPAGQSLAIEPNRFSVTIAYRCSTNQEQRLKNLLAQPLVLEVEADPADSFRFISLRDRITKESPLARLGIEIDNVTPEGLQISIVRLTTVRMPIQVDAGDYQLAGPPTLDPQEAEVLLPLSAVPAASEQHLIVRLADVDRALQPGQSYRHRLPVVAPAQLPSPTTITPQTVEVSFAIASEKKQLTLKSVLIVLQTPPQLAAEYSVELPNDLRVLPEPVEVTGQSDKIDKLAQSPDQVKAILQLSGDDFARGITSKVVELTLPEGVTTTRPPPKLDFVIVPRRKENPSVAPSLTPAPLTPPPAPTPSAAPAAN